MSTLPLIPHPLNNIIRQELNYNKVCEGTRSSFVAVYGLLSSNDLFERSLYTQDTGIKRELQCNWVQIGKVMIETLKKY